MKALMAVTGLILVGFLLMHMYGNLKVFLGEEAFDHYAHWLKGDILYPLIPSGWFIWIFRAFMLAAILLHAGSAWRLARKAKAARGSKYVVRKTIQETYAARTMRWGGVILGTFLIFHLLNMFGEKFVKEGITSPFIGMWLAVLVLTPVGVFLTYKAMHDSQLFNKEFYYRLFKGLQGAVRRPKKDSSSSKT